MGESGYLDRKVETASLGEIQKLQAAKLAEQLYYLFAHSLFYQEKFHAAGVRRKDYRQLHDVRRFPFTTKEELRESQVAHPPLGKHIACDVKNVIRVHSSTGTTGKPSFVGLTHREAMMWTRLTARSFYTQGLRKADVVIHAAGLTLFVAGLLAEDLVASRGGVVVPVCVGA